MCPTGLDAAFVWSPDRAELCCKIQLGEGGYNVIQRVQGCVGNMEREAYAMQWLQLTTVSNTRVYRRILLDLMLVEVRAGPSVSRRIDVLHKWLHVPLLWTSVSAFTSFVRWFVHQVCNHGTTMTGKLQLSICKRRTVETRIGTYTFAHILFNITNIKDELRVFCAQNKEKERTEILLDFMSTSFLVLFFFSISFYIRKVKPVNDLI